MADVRAIRRARTSSACCCSVSRSKTDDNVSDLYVGDRRSRVMRSPPPEVGDRRRTEITMLLRQCDMPE